MRNSLVNSIFSSRFLVRSQQNASQTFAAQQQSLEITHAKFETRPRTPGDPKAQALCITQIRLRSPEAQSGRLHPDLLCNFSLRSSTISCDCQTNNKQYQRHGRIDARGYREGESSQPVRCRASILSQLRCTTCDRAWWSRTWRV